MKAKVEIQIVWFTPFNVKFFVRASSHKRNRRHVNKKIKIKKK